MIAFDINGAIIKFDEQRDNYNTIRKIFLEYARKARKEFQEYCDENLTTFRQLNDKYLVFCERLIDEGIKKGVEILVSYNVIVVDFNIFKEKYCEKYFDFKLIFNNFLKEKDAIKNKKNVSRLFDIKPSIDKLSRSIYRDCFNIHMAVIDALLEYNVKDVESYIDIESIKQANALFNNYKDGSNICCIKLLKKYIELPTQKIEIPEETFENKRKKIEIINNDPLFSDEVRPISLVYENGMFLGYTMELENYKTAEVFDSRKKKIEILRKYKEKIEKFNEHGIY